MTSTIEARAVGALHAAVRFATSAPSVHNTQPWRFHIDDGELRVYADRSRQLDVLDPMKRQLMISVGAALFNARVAIASRGYTPVVTRLPDPDDPSLVATVAVAVRESEAYDDIARFQAAVRARHTNRRHFRDEHVPDWVVARLVAEARAEDAILYAVRSDADRLALARLARRADEIQILNPAYRAELRAWTTTDPDRPDGVPAEAVPHVDGTAFDDVPIRDFDTRGAGQLPAHTASSRRQCLLLIGTKHESRLDWLRAGEATQRVWLELTRRGYVASPLTQVVEVASMRGALISALGLRFTPHMLLRAGRAEPAPRSGRRAVADVLD